LIADLRVNVMMNPISHHIKIEIWKQVNTLLRYEKWPDWSMDITSKSWNRGARGAREGRTD
jgi:hypothetical protein